MPRDYLHAHPEFADLVRAVSDEKQVAPDLVEKDYWIMHCLFGLQQQGYRFELKGGTSLSKGFGIINRFSEDIDLRIEPRDENVFVGKNQNKPYHRESRRQFYDHIASEINIPGVAEVARDKAFDDKKYRSGGIRLHYDSAHSISAGLKKGILLELGFDTVTPNEPVSISSWVLDFARANQVDVVNNKAVDVACYHPGYTFVEKLQTVATKFRKQQATGEMPLNFMRHYYDIYCLLENDAVTSFIGTDAYHKHKQARFPVKDKEMPIQENEAFLLGNASVRNLYRQSYKATAGLYYQGQPDFDELLERIGEHLPML